jgi:hypothetical protein
VSPRRRGPPAAQSALVAAAERAASQGAVRGLVIWLPADGRPLWSSPGDLTPVEVLGMLAQVSHDVASGNVEAGEGDA